MMDRGNEPDDRQLEDRSQIKSAEARIRTRFAKQGIDDQSASRKGVWNFEVVPQLPSFPIDRFSIVVTAGAHVVAARIHESLRLRSVVATYEGASAMCRTRSFLKYAIYLYIGQGEDSTTLEIVRHNGCGFEFRREREMVQNAAKGYGAIPPTSLPMMMKIPADLLGSFKGPTEEENRNMILRSTERLQTESPEEKLFVLQHLCTNTSIDKVNTDSAVKVSELILKDDSDICTAIIANLKTFSDKCDDIGYQILSACLGIIANSMEALAKNLMLETIVKSSATLINEITKTILQIIEKSQCPHNKATALSCLSRILSIGQLENDIIDKKTTIDLVEKARTYGETYHRNLEQAAESALKVL